MFFTNKYIGADTPASKLRMIFTNIAIYFYKLYSLIIQNWPTNCDPSIIYIDKLPS